MNNQSKKRPNNIQKNILSLKLLQAEIEKLKNPSISSQKVVTDRKNGTETVTTRFRAAMSPFSLLFNLIITILKKLPIIGTYLSIFSEWYKMRVLGTNL